MEDIYALNKRVVILITQYPLATSLYSCALRGVNVRKEKTLLRLSIITIDDLITKILYLLNIVRISEHQPRL